MRRRANFWTLLWAGVTCGFAACFVVSVAVGVLMFSQTGRTFYACPLESYHSRVKIGGFPPDLYCEVDFPSGDSSVTVAVYPKWPPLTMVALSSIATAQSVALVRRHRANADSDFLSVTRPRR